jgi:hypothetical protein
MIVRHSVYNTNPWGDGGARRTAQLTELLARITTKAPFLELPTPVGRFTGAALFVREIGFLKRSGLPLRLRSELISTLGQNMPSFRKQLAGLPPGSVLIWDGTQSRFAYIPFLAREAGVKVIGLPHNLESLVPESHSFFTGSPAPNWLAEEIQSLAACDAVFTISREDQWLLRLHGIPAGYLPYHPPSEVEDFLQKICLDRQNAISDSEILLLGTAANPPTHAGMLDCLKFFTKNRHLFKRLHVVGYGTELLQNLVEQIDGVTLYGAVSNNFLRDLLLKVRAAVVHQSPTSGALTRISELLLAGVPVLADTNASRNFFNIPGVHIYENNTQLAELLVGTLPGNGSPARPATFERLFLERIQSLR